MLIALFYTWRFPGLVERVIKQHMPPFVDNEMPDPEREPEPPLTPQGRRFELRTRLTKLEEEFEGHITINAWEGGFHFLALLWWCGIMWLILIDLVNGTSSSPQLIELSAMVAVSIGCAWFAGLYAQNLQVLTVNCIRHAFDDVRHQDYWHAAEGLKLPSDLSLWSARDLQSYIDELRKNLLRQ